MKKFILDVKKAFRRRAGYLVGNERVVLYVADKEWVLNGIKKDNNVESVGEGELENPTLKVYTTSTTLIEILNSENQLNSFIQAEKGGKIRIDPVVVKRTVKFSIASLLSRFLKSDEAVQQLQDQKSQRKLRQANPNPSLLREESVKRRLSSDNPRPLPEPKPQELEPAFIVEGEDGEGEENQEGSEESQAEDFPCENANDCLQGRPLCINHFCRTINEFIALGHACDQDEDCSGNRVCYNHECVVEQDDMEEAIACETIADCPGERPFCINNACKTIAELIAAGNSCERDEDCSGNRVCDNHECVVEQDDVEEAIACETIADCPGERPFCINDACKTIAELIAAGNSCERDEDCS